MCVNGVEMRYWTTPGTKS